MSPEEVARHAEMLANRVKKTHRRLAAGFEREGVGAYRLYDRDIPEVRAVVDWVEGHLVVAEYVRAQTAAVLDYPGELARATARALSVPEDRVHVKRRRTGRDRGYARTPEGGERLVVRERGLRFLVDLDGALDTGLFADHRETRRLVAEASAGQRVLNLFAYTGTFTCAAARGGATATASVDASRQYVDWIRDNLALNGIPEAPHELRVQDVDTFLARDRRRFGLAIVDPPSRSMRYGAGELDVIRDHPALLARVAERMLPGGKVLFATNHQRFEPAFHGLPYASIEEITDGTVPSDYRNRTVHRAFWLVR